MGRRQAVAEPWLVLERQRRRWSAVWETRKSHIFIPCGHFCACQRCADEIMAADKAACPMCRQAATTCTRVYG